MELQEPFRASKALGASGEIWEPDFWPKKTLILDCGPQGSVAQPAEYTFISKKKSIKSLPGLNLHDRKDQKMNYIVGQI